MKNRKLVSLFSAMAVAVGLLAGCAAAPAAPAAEAPAAEETATEETAEEEPAVEQVSSGEKQDLLLWMPPAISSSEDTLDKEFWTNVLAPWAEKNNVNLSIEIIPWGNYEEKHLTGYSSGAGPDVTYMYSEMISSFIDMGAIEPMDSYFSEEELDEYMYPDQGIVHGQLYEIPFIVGAARILFCNMDILNQAGVDAPPTTWDELVEVGQKVKELNLDGVITFGQQWADPAIGALNSIYYPYLWEAEGKVYNDEETAVALLDNDGAVRAAQFDYDLMYTYGITSEECLGMTESDLVTEFTAGNVAMAYFPANNGKQYTEAGINWDFCPSLKDKTTAVWVASDGLTLNAASKNKDLAVSLIKEITGTEVMTQFHAIMPQPPITKGEEYQDDERFKELYADAEHLHHLPRASTAYKVMDTLYKNLQLMMIGQITPEEAIQQTVDYASSIE